MIWHEQVSAEAVVATFLKAESNSSRFRNRIEKQISNTDHRWEYILNPDISNEEQNIFRENILAQTRGWPNKPSLLDDFPLDTLWYAVTFERSDLQGRLKYLAEASWVAATGETLSPLEILKNEPDHPILKLASRVDLSDVEPILCVTESTESECIAFEGNMRTTVFALSHQPTLRAIVGISKNASDWKYFSLHSYLRAKAREITAP